MKFICTLAAIAALMVALTACEHKDLCYDHGHSVDLDVRFNWSAAPDADPHTMVVRLYSLDGKHIARHEFTSRDGGKIRVEAGEYRILFHNGEMETVNEKPGEYDDYELFTTEESLLAPMSREMGAPPRPKPSENEPVKSSPDQVWAGKHEYLMVVRGEEGQSVELFPAEATASYTVTVINVENLRNNISMSGALTGLSERFHVGDERTSGVPVTIPFPIGRKDPTTLETQFYTFGHCPESNSVQHILSLYFSNMTYYNFDVTDQVHNAPDSKNVHIYLDGLTLKVESDGMSPSIDDWDEIEDIEIKM